MLDKRNRGCYTKIGSQTVCGVILSVLQSAANLLIYMIAGGNHTAILRSEVEGSVLPKKHTEREQVLRLHSFVASLRMTER